VIVLDLPSVVDDVQSEMSIEEFSEYVLMLDSDDRKQWIKVMFLLKNYKDIYGNEQMYKLFKKYSRKCPKKYNKFEIMKKWSEDYNADCHNKITIGSLIHLCRETNLTEYMEIKNRYIDLDSEDLRKKLMDQYDKTLVYGDFRRKWCNRETDDLKIFINDL